MLRKTGEGLFSAGDELVKLQADVGAAQEHIEDVTARNSARKASLSIARNELLAADPYETSIRLQSAQSQLESLFSVIARNARLSLVNYLQ